MSPAGLAPLDLPAAPARAAQVPTRSLAAWLPLLWSQVLFPWRSSGNEPARIGSLLLLLVLPGLVLYPCTSFLLFEPDEGRYAQIPREMLERGEWVVPQLQGEPYLDKPPLFYWLVMLSYSLFGYHDWAARLVPALSVHGCVLLTYLLGRRALGERGAFWGALLLALVPGFTGMARLLVLDGVMTFCVTLALLLAFEALKEPKVRRGPFFAAALACGLALLCKGPVIFVLIGPPLWLYRRLTGAPRVGWRSVLAFAAVAVAVALPWYVLAALRAPDFTRYFLWEHNVVRFVVAFDHKQPAWYYLPILLFGTLPFTPLLVPHVRSLLSGDPRGAAGRTQEAGFFLLAGLWCVLFFSASSCKLPTYILPAFPPLCLALGAYVASSGWRRSPWTVFGVGFAYGFMAFGHFVAAPWYAELRSPMSNPREVHAYCADRGVPVVCFPRNLDSVAFYLGRDDLRSFRSKETHLLVQQLQRQPRTVVLFSRQHSLDQLRKELPPTLRMVRPVEWEELSMAVVERRR